MYVVPSNQDCLVNLLKTCRRRNELQLFGGEEDSKWGGLGILVQSFLSTECNKWTSPEPCIPIRTRYSDYLEFSFPIRGCNK